MKAFTIAAIFAASAVAIPQWGQLTCTPSTVTLPAITSTIKLPPPPPVTTTVTTTVVPPPVTTTVTTTVKIPPPPPVTTTITSTVKIPPPPPVTSTITVPVTYTYTQPCATSSGWGKWSKV